MKKLLLSMALVLSVGNVFGASVTTWNRFKEEKLEQLRSLEGNRSASEETNFQALLREKAGGGYVKSRPDALGISAISSSGLIPSVWNKDKEAKLNELKEKGANRTQVEEVHYQALLRMKPASN